MADERIEFFAKGYKKGLEEAWNEILQEGSSGYSLTELRMVIKAKMSTIDQRVEAHSNLLKKELGITDETVSSGDGGELIEGCSYLVKESRPRLSYLLFNYLIKQGHPGLCITRQSRNVISKKYGIEKFTHIKLGKKDSDSAVLSSALGLGDSISSSANLTKLFEKITKFMEENHGAVILMDGAVEYLMTENDFQRVLIFIQRLNDRLEPSGAYLFIGISPDALKKQEMAALERETTDTLSEDDS